MKRLSTALLFAVLLICTSFSAAAQFRYAPVLGVTMNSLKFKQDLFPVGHQVGAQAGVMSELMFPGIGFGMDFGLIYNMMGAKTDIGTREIWASDGFSDTQLRIHTFDIPFHLRFKWTRMNGLEDYIAPFVYGGPDFSISFAHSKVKGNKGVKNPFTFPGGDLGLTAGGGFEIMHRWQISLQYTWGMTYIVKTRKLENQSARNRQWAVRVAYFLK